MYHRDVDQIVQSIAAETNTPAETVARMYADTLDHYRADARIEDYLPLFVERKVRAELRNSKSTTRH